MKCLALPATRSPRSPHVQGQSSSQGVIFLQQCSISSPPFFTGRSVSRAKVLVPPVSLRFQFMSFHHHVKAFFCGLSSQHQNMDLTG